MINSFLSLNLAFTVVVFISTLFLFIGIFYSRKKVSLNTYLVSDRNEGVFSLSATLIASSLGAWILFGPPTAATWGGFGSVIGYALGTAFPMILLIFFGKKIRLLLPKGKSLTELVLKKFGKNLFKLIFSLIIFYLFIFLCAEVTAISKLIYYISGLNIWISASIILFFTLTYVLFGGLKKKRLKKFGRWFVTITRKDPILESLKPLVLGAFLLNKVLAKRLIFTPLLVAKEKKSVFVI